jgi:hypothetical protein
MLHGRTPVSRAEFEANLAEKEADAAFIGDVHALLATGPGPRLKAGPVYDAKVAIALVRRELIERLRGDAWKGKL